MKTWRIEQLTGYHPITTFYEDFSIADMFGVSAIKDTYRRSMNEWKDKYKYLTELAMALNWKSFEHCESNKEYSELYSELWIETDKYAKETLHDEELSYYYRTTD